MKGRAKERRSVVRKRRGNVTTPKVSLLSGASDGAETTRRAVNRCQEESGLQAPEEGSLRPPAVIAGIGTTAAHALQGRLLLDALARQHVELGQAIPFGDPEALSPTPGGSSRWC
jgi:shikimate dehydrogenase